MVTTKIAGRVVHIKDGPKTTITFSEGRGGPEEAGDWEFWTAVYGRKRCTARCREEKDPGERFCRMEGEPGYEGCWEIARQADYLRPATFSKLEEWLNTHPDDAPYAESGEVGGDKVTIVKRGWRYWATQHQP